MTDREAHKLKRVELLELLTELSKENDMLKKENGALRKQLDDKMLKIENCGSLAEAAIQICGVLEAAQKAADCYLENLKLMHATNQQRNTNEVSENEIC